MNISFLLVLLLIAMTCLHVIVGKQNAESVRANTDEAFVFKSYLTIKLIQLIVSLILENKGFTSTREIKIKVERHFPLRSIWRLWYTLLPRVPELEAKGEIKKKDREMNWHSHIPASHVNNK